MIESRWLPVRSLTLSACLSLSALAITALAPHADAALPASGAADSAAAPVKDGAARDPSRDSLMARLYEAEKKLRYRTGEIKLEDGLAVVRLPDGYRYLDEEQTDKVLTEMWGNPKGSKTLGMILAPDMTPLKDDSWAVIIQYDEDGYVKDDDAEKIDYDDMLKDMQKSAQEENKEREKEGFEPIHIVGWAEKPHYDKAAHKLHWAKELRFGNAEANTLNYNIRILGRRGVLVLNAVSGMSSFAAVKEGVKPILAAVDFQDGHKYSEFDPKLDKVATYGIGGLVAGGILAKAGFFKLLLAGILALKKFIVIGLLAVVAFFRKFFKGPSAQKEIKDVVREMPSQEKDATKT